MSFSEDNSIDWESVLGLPKDSIDDDIKGTDELSLSNKLYKTDEEIQRFTINENMDDLSRALFLLRNGALIQKLSVINSLRKLLRDYKNEIQIQIIPILLDLVYSEPLEFQVSTGKMIKDLVDQFSPKNITLVYKASKKLMDSKYIDVSDVWSDVLISTIKFLPIEILSNEILPEALVDGGLAQPSSFRIWCCRVLGAVAPRLDKKKIEDAFLKKAIALCQDTDYEVRASLCDQLNAIARAIGLDITKRELVYEYKELVSDEHQYVKERSLVNLIQLLDFLDIETKQSFVIPCFKKHIEDKSDPLLPLIVKEFGPFLWHTKDSMTELELKDFMQFYINMSLGPNIDYRKKCAFNYPGILLSLGVQSFETFKLNQIFSYFTQDENIEVRKIAACCLHEIAKILCKSHSTFVRASIVKLLSDEELDISKILFKHLNETLDELYSDESMKKTAQIDEVLLFIIRKERECATDLKCEWRIHYELLANFEKFHLYFESDQIFERCVPLLFKILSENVVVPIKQVVMKNLCTYVRYLKRSDCRDQIFKRILSLKDSLNYHNRMLFLDFIELSLGMFSKKYFRDILFHEYLELSHDPVANIRLRFVSLLPSVRKTLRLPTDNSLLQKLTDALEPLLTRDLDRDVVQATGDVFEELGLFGFGPNDIDPQFLPSKGNLVNNPSNTSEGSLTDKHLNNEFMQEPDEALDKQKEQEEHDLLVKEWTNDEFSKKKFESKKSSTVKKSETKKATTASNPKKKGAISSITPRESTTLSPALPRSATTASSTTSKSSYKKPTNPTTSTSTDPKASPPLITKIRGSLTKSASYKPGSITPKFVSSPKSGHLSTSTTANLQFDTKFTSPRNGSAPLARHATDIQVSRGSNVSGVTTSIHAMGISPPNPDKFLVNPKKLSKPK